jgi:manganese-transporting P-type ATPase
MFFELSKWEYTSKNK